MRSPWRRKFEMREPAQRFRDCEKGHPMKWIMLASLAAAFANPASAQDAATKQRMDAAQADLSVCIAYYMIIKECSAIAPAEATIEALATKSSALERTLGMPAEDAAIRLELNLAIQRGLIQNACSNLHTLRSRYSDQCASLAR
jgi:hypothetical protein